MTGTAPGQTAPAEPKSNVRIRSSDRQSLTVDILPNLSSRANLIRPKARASFFTAFGSMARAPPATQRSRRGILISFLPGSSMKLDDAVPVASESFHVTGCRPMPSGATTSSRSSS